MQYIEEVESFVYQDFECDRQELNDFFKNDALEYHQDNITRTTLVFVDNKFIGYFGLSSDALKLTSSQYLSNYFLAQSPSRL